MLGESKSPATKILRRSDDESRSEIGWSRLDMARLLNFSVHIVPPQLGEFFQQSK